MDDVGLTLLAAALVVMTGVAAWSFRMVWRAAAVVGTNETLQATVKTQAGTIRALKGEIAALTRTVSDQADRIAALERNLADRLLAEEVRRKRTSRIGDAS
jgi:hypothetical protein